MQRIERQINRLVQRRTHAVTVKKFCALKPADAPTNTVTQGNQLLCCLFDVVHVHQYTLLLHTVDAYNSMLMQAMKIDIMRTIQTITTFFLLFYLSSVWADHLVIRNAYIPEGPPVSRVLAAFMEIENTSGDTTYIDKITSPDFGAIEMHLSKEVDGVARMFPQIQLVIKPHSRLVLKPGSYHLMLFRPQRPLKDGDRCEFTFTLGNGNSFKHNINVKKID